MELSLTLPSSNLKLPIKLLMRTHARAIKMKFHRINSGGLSWKTKCTCIFGKKINIQRNYPSAHVKVLSSQDLNPGKNEKISKSEKKEAKYIKVISYHGPYKASTIFFSEWNFQVESFLVECSRGWAPFTWDWLIHKHSRGLNISSSRGLQKKRRRQWDFQVLKFRRFKKRKFRKPKY